MNYLPFTRWGWTIFRKSPNLYFIIQCENKFFLANKCYLWFFRVFLINRKYLHQLIWSILFIWLFPNFQLANVNLFCWKKFIYQIFNWNHEFIITAKWQTTYFVLVRDIWWCSIVSRICIKLLKKSWTILVSYIHNTLKLNSWIIYKRNHIIILSISLIRNLL